MTNSNSAELSLRRRGETSPEVLDDPLKENIDTEQNAEHISLFLLLTSEHSARCTKPDDSL
jgi:hypothetical protein